MKIKIKRSLKERYGLSPTSDLPIEKMFDVAGMSPHLELTTASEEIESIFNKDLVFYDLETTGLRRSSKGEQGDEEYDPSDTIHQIACLRYSTGGNLDKLNPESPVDAYIAKCEITKEQLEKTAGIKRKRAYILNQTQNNEYTEFKKYITDDQFTYNVKNSDDVAGIQALFNHIFINYTISNKQKGKLKGIKNNTIIEYILKYAGTLGNGREVYDEVEKILENKNPSMEDLKYIFKNIFDDSGVELDMAGFFKKRAIEYPSKMVDRYSTTTGITIEENKVFTHYDAFPMEKYQDKKHYPAGGVNSEKDALQGMMDYFDTLGTGAQKDPPTDGDYILVGQNIISFDNPFVLARCKALGITNVHTFQNSRVYDTRFLFSTMIKYFKNLSYFYSLGGGKMAAVRANLFKKTQEKHASEMDKLKKTSEEATRAFDQWLKSNNYNKALTKQEKSALKSSQGEDKLKEYEKIYKAHKYLKQQLHSYFIYPEDVDNFQNIVKSQKQTLEPVIEEVNQILKDLTMSGTPKGKLSTLMKAFIESAPKQTHTADDDCEKLAMVLIPSLKKFHEIYEKTKEFVRQIDQIKTVQRYRTAKGSGKAVSTDYYDPELKRFRKSRKTYKTQSQRSSSGLKFDETDLSNLRKKIAGKIYLDVLTKDKLKDEHKELDKQKVIKIFAAALKSFGKVDQLINLLNMNSDESVLWYESSSQPDPYQGDSWRWTEDDIFITKENKNRVKIKILRENKISKNNKKCKKILIKRNK